MTVTARAQATEVDDLLERVALDPALPSSLFRLEWLAGYGYPRCERRERTGRWYRRADDAARQVAVLAHQPDHHKLVGCWQLVAALAGTAWEWADVTGQVIELARDRLASDLVGTPLADDEGE